MPLISSSRSLAQRFLKLRNDGSKFFYSHPLKTSARRWIDVVQIVDLRPADRLLDMGCAEGLLTMEAAPLVTHAHGVEISKARVERATTEARRRGIGNVTFEAGSVTDFDPNPGYDVVLLLSVIGKKTETGYVGLAELERLARATRRQIIIRIGYHLGYERKGLTIPTIFAKLDELDFDCIALCHNPNVSPLIVGNRRGTDARLRLVPPLALIPTESLKGHPCLQGATVGKFSDFTPNAS
ncbi:MAG: methyltransferase domain-containing protein [Pseudolabrys sp.]